MNQTLSEADGGWSNKDFNRPELISVVTTRNLYLPKNASKKRLVEERERVMVKHSPSFSSFPRLFQVRISPQDLFYVRIEEDLLYRLERENYDTSRLLSSSGAG